MLNFLITPLFQLLQSLNDWTGNFGISIIILTLVSRIILLPLTLPSLRAQHENRKKMKALQPKLQALKKKHANDKTAFYQAQAALYKEHGLNLTSGLLPNLLQLFILIVLYQALNRFLHPGIELSSSVSHFFGINLVAQDKTYILPILAGVSQFFFSVMLLPGLEKHDIVPNNGKTKVVKKANKEETQEEDMSVAMQQQMVFILPFMTGFLAARFSAGLALYWVSSTVFSIVQQYFVSGWGGVEDYAQRLGKKLAILKEKKEKK